MNTTSTDDYNEILVHQCPCCKQDVDVHISHFYDEETRILYTKNHAVELTRLEGVIFRLLNARFNKVVRCETLFYHLEFESNVELLNIRNALAVHILKINNKIPEDLGIFIKNINGEGFILTHGVYKKNMRISEAISRKSLRIRQKKMPPIRERLIDIFGEEDYIGRCAEILGYSRSTINRYSFNHVASHNFLKNLDEYEEKMRKDSA